MGQVRVAVLLLACTATAWTLLKAGSMIPAAPMEDDPASPTPLFSTKNTPQRDLPLPLILPHKVYSEVQFSHLLNIIQGVDDNSVGPTEEEIRYAREAMIVPLRNIPSLVDAEMKAVLAWFQVEQASMDPIVVEISPAVTHTSWGNTLASVHSNATVVTFCSDGCREGRGSPRNHYLLEIPSDGKEMETFSKVCHFFSVLFLPDMFRHLMLSPQYIHALDAMLPLARTTYVVAQHDVILEALGKISTCTIRYRVIHGSSAGKGHASTCIVRIDVVKMQRSCLKTWDASQVQWDRRTTVAYDESTGMVSFEVQSNKKRLARRIHPFSYVPSINVNTLLSIGIKSGMSLRIYAMMVATPRYSDPMPHNWLVGRGGNVLRIDKVDKRYDQDVSEHDYFWGKSTVGYLRLLTENLCLVADPKIGIPKLALAQCKVACGLCASSCSYVPKGTAVCAACLSCSECIAAEGHRLSIIAPFLQVAGGAPKKCKFPYKTFTGGNRIWRRWESEANLAVHHSKT